MRLKASNKAFETYLFKNWASLKIPIVGGGKKVLEGMEQEELEKRLKIEPCADEVELDFILDIKKYDHLSKELKKDLIKIRIDEARRLIQSFMNAIENLKTDHKDLYLDDYRKARRKDSGQEFLKAMNCFWAYNDWIEQEDFLLSGCDISNGMDWDKFKNGVPEMLEIYKEMLEEILLDSPEENNKCFFLDLLKTDSPFTHKAIVKGLETGRIEITHEGKLNFKAMTKGSLVHIFKEGGYTEWSRVKENVLLKGQEVGELKDLAAKEPPKEFERIEKELYKI